MAESDIQQQAFSTLLRVAGALLLTTDKPQIQFSKDNIGEILEKFQEGAGVTIPEEVRQAITELVEKPLTIARDKDNRYHFISEDAATLHGLAEASGLGDKILHTGALTQAIQAHDKYKASVLTIEGDTENLPTKDELAAALGQFGDGSPLGKLAEGGQLFTFSGPLTEALYAQELVASVKNRVPEADLVPNDEKEQQQVRASIDKGAEDDATRTQAHKNLDEVMKDVSKLAQQGTVLARTFSQNPVMKPLGEAIAVMASLAQTAVMIHETVGMLKEMHDSFQSWRQGREEQKAVQTVRELADQAGKLDPEDKKGLNEITKRFENAREGTEGRFGGAVTEAFDKTVAKLHERPEKDSLRVGVERIEARSLERQNEPGLFGRLFGGGGKKGETPQPTAETAKKETPPQTPVDKVAVPDTTPTPDPILASSSDVPKPGHDFSSNVANVIANIENGTQSPTEGHATFLTILDVMEETGASKEDIQARKDQWNHFISPYMAEVNTQSQQAVPQGEGTPDENWARKTQIAAENQTGVFPTSPQTGASVSNIADDTTAPKVDAAPVVAEMATTVATETPQTLGDIIRAATPESGLEVINVGGNSQTRGFSVSLDEKEYFVGIPTLGKSNDDLRVYEKRGTDRQGHDKLFRIDDDKKTPGAMDTAARVIETCMAQHGMGTQVESPETSAISNAPEISVTIPGPDPHAKDPKVLEAIESAFMNMNAPFGMNPNIAATGIALALTGVDDPGRYLDDCLSAMDKHCGGNPQLYEQAFDAVGTIFGNLGAVQEEAQALAAVGQEAARIG